MLIADHEKPAGQSPGASAIEGPRGAAGILVPMFTAREVFAVSALVAFGGCSSTSTNYTAYEGGGTLEGTGGTRKTVDGIDIWDNGTPPRKYKVIGIIDDTRRKSVFGMSGYEEDLAKKAREAGADAIVILGAHNELRGIYTSGGSGSYGSQPIRDQVTKAAVIKYVN
jgi:hypothetical protein